MSNYNRIDGRKRGSEKENAVQSLLCAMKMVIKYFFCKGAITWNQ